MTLDWTCAPIPRRSDVVTKQFEQIFAAPLQLQVISADIHTLGKVVRR